MRNSPVVPNADTPSNDPFADHYQQLNGKTVTGIAKDDSDHEAIYGLILDDGSIAWILRDPEGNGPGFLEYQLPSR